jgi:CBS domain-containing protein
MSRHPVCVDESATIEEVVKQMDIYQISQVLVLRDKKLAGIVGRTEMLVALEPRLRK